MGYVRGDGVTAVVYPGLGRMHELTLVDDHWVHTDLSRPQVLPLIQVFRSLMFGATEFQASFITGPTGIFTS